MEWFRTKPVPALHQELEPAAEKRHTDRLERTLRAKMERDYGAGTMLRDAHPKLHGLVNAEFRVSDDLPDELAAGIFQRGRAYRALVRFSNQNARVSSDRRRDIRGAAIKLFGIDGPVLDQDRDRDAEPTQDFILISINRFVTPDVATFDGLIQALVSGLPRQAWFFLRHPRVVANLLASLQHHRNPLGTRYFSVVPYRLAERAVKYSLIPRSPVVPPPAPSDDQLRHAMAAQLHAGSAAFDFAVQFQTDARRMPVENPALAWSEERSPFRTVATLHIPAQTFDTPEMRALAETLAFNPWHARAEHRPLGGINRARRQVYRALAAFRREHNATRPPTAIPHGTGGD